MMEIIMAFGLSLVFNYVLKVLGMKLGFVDKPAGTLKPHEKPIPYLGGTAILLSISPWFLNYPEYFFPFIVMWIVGFIDDKRGLSPKVRLFIELASGFSISYIIFGYSFFDSAILAFVFTMAVNAYNMVDGLDGICAGNTIIFSVFAFMAGFSPDISLAVAGAFAGYLLYNFPPAKVFMGDQGSYLAGTFVGLLLLESWESQNFVRIAAFCWPVLLDLFVGFARRSLAGKSPLKGDRDHYYDKIFAITGKKKRATFFITSSIALFYALVGLLLPVTAIPFVLIISSVVQVFLLKSLRLT
ncbi:MAG TPA: MraY family glycosyltransferase [Mesotoga infera]|jgi:UDP-N-acetylmuramyl pentapeptide phosphotransferase/UDP-N-acetylglucosamine-1-phosphate transferase|nr:undecaprenyl/decaprenyl-phosphate alpha-N-acetylglucosaminyl 1-phosphate transferase [Mesotoga sp.]NLI05860.1 undecaprenyl/decaprenyl-phosphate alpha-N-acetylglucosaminyl 1-phosphate transferase [Thermotogaceae bacterium]HNR78984.1 MraY family glycosyltransferase [Mesotoga infera]HNS66549.1 MraY family glycosyltransferase [Mesotoga infera]HON27696.1 MraY family glycosyltransferase [Mesotoga infera]